MRRKLSMFILSSLLILAIGIAPAQVSANTDEKVALPSRVLLSVDNYTLSPQIYNIDGYNYFKLRDIAYLFRDSECAFSVDYNAKSRLVEINTSQNYLPVGNELNRNSSSLSKQAIKNNNSIIVDGKSVYLTAYNIDGNNYFKLAELKEVLGFTLKYFSTTNLISINTNKAPYAPIEFSSDENSTIANMKEYIKDNFIQKVHYTESIYEVEPDLKNYTPGVITENSLDDGLRAINYGRYLAGIPYDVKLDEALNESAQYGALVLAINDELLHAPENKYNIPEDIFNKGYSATTSSNLYHSTNEAYLTYYGNLAYFDDSGKSNIAHVGHRRWVLNPNMQYTGIGAVGQYSVTKAFDETRSPVIDPEYVAFPQGLFPEDASSQMFDTRTAWSFTIASELKNAKYYITNEEDVKVTLTRENDNKTWEFTKENTSSVDKSGSDTSNDVFNVDAHPSYGYGPTIIFRPAIDKYRSGDVFTVKIENIQEDTNWIDGKEVIHYNLEYSPNLVDTTVEYTVKFFSLYEL